jgi:hypothetical protein
LHNCNIPSPAWLVCSFFVAIHINFGGVRHSVSNHFLNKGLFEECFSRDRSQCNENQQVSQNVWLSLKPTSVDHVGLPNAADEILCLNVGRCPSIGRENMSKKRSKKLALLRLATFPLASVVWIARPASADTYCFVSGEGTTWDNTSTLPWYDQTNPLSVAVPPNNGTADAVLGNFGVAHYITSNTNVTFNYTYTTGINYLEIDSGNTLTQSSSGTAMVCSTEVLGDDGGGTYTQSAGSNTINGANNFGVGFASGESSTYNLSGTGQFSDTGSGYGEVGNFGNGTFTQTGGTASVTNELDLGEFANSVGVYNLSNTTGTGSLTVGTLDVGYQGSGTFTQSGGTNQTGTLILAAFSGSSGAYTINGGTLKATTVTVNANGNFDQTGGTMTFTTFNQYAGTVSLSGGLNLASSTYALSGGSLSTSSITGTALNLNWTSGSLTLTNQPFDVSTVPDTAYNGFVDGSSLTLNSGMSLAVSAAASHPWEFIFGSGSTVTQNAGSSNTTPEFYLGSTGTNATADQYTLNGGAFTSTAYAYVGWVNAYPGPGAGIFNQSGGTSSFSNLYVGNAGPGTYSLSAGTMGVSGSISLYSGSTFHQSGGSLSFPTFNEFGGTANFDTGLNLTSSTFNLSGGSLTTSAITGSASNLNWTSGSLTLTGQAFDVSTVPDTAYNGFVDGSSLTLNSGMSLTVSAAASDPWEYIFGSGSSVTQNTGSSNTTPYFYLGSTGTNATVDTYTLAGGAFTSTEAYAGWEYTYPGPGAGIFNQSGGTSSFFDLYVGYSGPGTYSLSAGTMGVSGSISLYSGSIFHQSGGSLSFGTFVEYGGTANFDTGLNLTSSTVALSGGSLTTASLKGPGSNLQWTNGSLTLSNQAFDVTTASSDPNLGGYIYGSSLTLGSGMSLTLPDASSLPFEFVFGSGSSITQNTGSSNTMYELLMGSSGTGTPSPVQYNLNGGTLTATYAVIGDNQEYAGPGAGTFTQTNGTASIGALYIGEFGGASSYSISSGSLIVSSQIENNSGSAIHQTGGSLTSPQTLNNGTMTQTAGTAALGPLTGTGTISVGGGSNSASTSVTSFTQQSISIGSDGLFTLLPNSTSTNTVTTLSMTGSGQLDLTNNRMFIDYGSGPDPIASVAQWIKNGFYDLAGPQIISSVIGADDLASGLSYGIGYADGADGLVAGLPSGEIEIAFTLLGDANLDGTVNSEDFTPFSHNLGLPGGWDQGDFNYDRTVNAEDFTSFSHNLNQTASLASAGSLESADGINLANVPEPVSAGMMVMAGLGIVRRRRRAK